MTSFSFPGATASSLPSRLDCGGGTKLNWPLSLPTDLVLNPAIDLTNKGKGHGRAIRTIQTYNRIGHTV